MAAAALPDHAAVDRLVRGPGWIALVGALLIGIVGLQVSMLRINSGSGQAVEEAAALQRGNERLQATVARLSSAERIRKEAESLGMVTPPAERVRYVAVRPGDRRDSAAALRAGAFGPGAAVAPAPGTTEEDGEAIDVSNDGDPSNDPGAILSDGDPSNDAQAMLNDGDPSNDAEAMLNDGDPSNDQLALAGGGGDGTADGAEG